MTDEFLVDLAALGAAPRPVAEVGGKAANLGRLIAAGAAVPPGFVVTAEGLERCFGEPPEMAGQPATLARPVAGRRATTSTRTTLLAAVAARAEQLEPPLIVRSSASIEDGETAAPGLFSTVRGVAADQVAAALATVWESARTPLVTAYLEAHRRVPAEVRIAAVVQQQVVAAVAGVLYTKLPGHPGAVLLETEVAGTLHSIEITSDDDPLAIIGRGLETASAGPSLHPSFPLTATTVAEVVGAGRAAATAIGSPAADVEWVFTGTTLFVVQARPLPQSVVAEVDRTPPPELFAFSTADPERIWRWDASHNPEPLSPAQAGLVELVDVAGLAPYRQRVVGGYLYATDPVSTEFVANAMKLRDRFERTLRPDIESALTPVEAAEPPSLASALASFTAVYKAYAGTLAPILRACHRELVRVVEVVAGSEVDRWVADLLGEGSQGGLERAIEATARGEISIAELRTLAAPQSPSWDVAAPTYGEDPESIDRALRRASAKPPRADPTQSRGQTLRARMAPNLHADFDQALEAARLAQHIGEIDDWLFARAQTGVRRALLAIADRWQLADPSDIFLLPLAAISTHPDQPPADLADRVEAARRLLAEQGRWAMPMAFCAGRPLAVHRHRSPANCFVGRGTGGQVSGVVVKPEDLSRDELPLHPVLVARTITPAMAFLVQGIAAVVSDHGSLLGHGAAMARELRIPCVVGCTDASTQLNRGDQVWVDGQAGLVVRIIPPV